MSRFVATTTPSKDGSFFELLLDVNVTLFPLTVGEDVTMVLAPSLAAGGGDGNGEELAEDYDYVMHGKVRPTHCFIHGLPPSIFFLEPA